MKTRFLRVGRSVTALALAAFLPGCLDGSEQPAANGAEKTATKSISKNADIDSPPVVTAPALESAPNLEAAPSSEATPKPALTLPKLSPGLAEVIRLAQAQVGEGVLLAYIDKSAFEFNPSLEEILYLHDVGISEPVLTAILHRSKQQADTVAKLAEAQAAMTKNVAARKAEVPVLKPAPSIVPEQPAPEPVAAPTQVVVQPVVYTQPVVISQPVFYNELSPYGTWIEIGSYGRCWQPTVAVVDLSWRPYYHRGRWLDTDCGWYWQSDYSWGWAPFHYGRWHQDRSCGWVWVPGDTWAPAWVSWRSSNAYCGWAPLPPSARYGSGVGFSYYNSRVGVNFEFGLSSSHYTFLPINRFCDNTPSRHYVPTTQVHTVYQQTTIVNNYITGDNNTVINRGVDHKAVVAAAPGEIRKVSVRDATGEHARHIRPDRLVKDGESVAIFRPQVAGLAATTPVTTVVRTEKSSPQQPASQPSFNNSGSAASKHGGNARPENVPTINPSGQRELIANREAIRKPTVESRPTEGRPLTTANVTPAAPAVANTQPTPNNPIVPLVSSTPKSLTVPQMKRQEGRPEATDSIVNRLESVRPKVSQPQISVQTVPQLKPAVTISAPQAPSNFQAPKLSGTTTQSQTPTLSSPRSNPSEQFSRSEIQRPAPPARSTFQAPAISAPTPQPQTQAPLVSPPSRSQFNQPAPASQPPPAVVAPPPSNPGSSRLRPTPPPQRSGDDQHKGQDKRNR